VEGDHLISRGVLCQDVRVRYTLIAAPQNNYSVRRLCKMLEVHPSGFYAWRLKPESQRAKEVKRLLVPIKQSWLVSGAVYGYRTRSATTYASLVSRVALTASIA
jgi:putative transposase